MQMKAQGNAPVALRWSRLKNRYEVHRSCLGAVVSLLEKVGCNHHVVERAEMHRGMLDGKDLVITVGGDGTVLNAASFVGNDIPVLGINSDPTKPEELGVNKVEDERRSRGALCALSANNINDLLPLALTGQLSPRTRTRIQCVVKSTHTETKLAPALNDILIAHPNPAQISRFRMTLYHNPRFYENSNTIFKPDPPDMQKLFSFNAWCSGMWICTATGSTAAMSAAGGDVMELSSKSLQYMVREHLVEQGQEHLKAAAHGIVGRDQIIKVRWNSQHGCVFVDGSHMEHSLQLGDEVAVDGHAPTLEIFEVPHDIDVL
eukprot:CAMPEP_0185026702 /NCGR_PEP_ID=MMETSP1103-20130426/11017_1 /TAXON_ID=36769 /ORGANISM="Paraphysomonas bandaiensis, Strain Caron Lab Isolate" /LENGTH=317 /DNA_ID=CAMNT_0027560367 /DNA_START=120 /DNA_END=1073 /DNA_ORIENTATION=-